MAYVLVNTWWDNSDTLRACKLFSNLETAKKELETKRQKVEKSWETSQDHVIDGVVTDKIIDTDNGFEVHELHYFLWGSRDWVFEYGYEIRWYELEEIQKAYDCCNYKDGENYIEDLSSVIDTDKSITLDFCYEDYDEDYE